MMLFYQYTKKKTQDLDRLPFSYYMNNEDELESMLKIIPLATNNTKKCCVGKKNDMGSSQLDRQSAHASSFLVIRINQ